MQIVSTNPAQGSANIPVEAVISIDFDIDVDITSIDTASITVATVKTNVLTPETTGINADIYNDDSFFNPEFTGIVDGIIVIDPGEPKRLLFTPKFRLKTNTLYTIYVAKAIAGTDASILDNIYSVTFTTDAADSVVPVPVPDVSVIIGSPYTPEGEVISTEPLFVTDTNPIEDSILNSGDTITINFNVAIGDETGTIKVYSEGIFSDFPRTEITPASIVKAGDNLSIDITLTEEFGSNLIYSVVIKGLKILDASSTMPTKTISFLSLLAPYYSSMTMLRMMAGSLISKITDQNLATMLHWQSVNADIQLKKIVGVTHYAHMRDKWVMYTTLKQLLLSNQDNGVVDSFKKTLAQYTISITNGSGVKLFNSLRFEINQFLKEFNAMLNFRYSHGIAVKGALFTKVLPRVWSQGHQPGLNTRHATTRIPIWDSIGTPIPWGQ